MMRAGIFRQLFRAYLEGDDAGFRKAGLQLAAAESTAGHTRIAEELRAVLSKLPAVKHRSSVVDIAQPRGDLADILEGGFRDERLGDVVLRPSARNLLERIIMENRSRQQLEQFSVSPRRRLLFHGPPGCGKTLSAAVLAGEMGLPLLTVRMDALFSRFLGATSNHLRAIFAEMPRRPGVYLFDEFDAVAKARGDAHDVGEMRRIVTSFLQLVDADKSASILIAATNHSEILDRGVFRRFDLLLSFDLPDAEQIRSLMDMRFRSYEVPKKSVSEIATSAVGMSFSDVARACDDAIRSMALEGRSKLDVQDIEHAILAAKDRTTHRSKSPAAP